MNSDQRMNGLWFICGYNKRIEYEKISDFVAGGHWSRVKETQGDGEPEQPSKIREVHAGVRV